MQAAGEKALARGQSVAESRPATAPSAAAGGPSPSRPEKVVIQAPTSAGGFDGHSQLWVRWVCTAVGLVGIHSCQLPLNLHARLCRVLAGITDTLSLGCQGEL